MSPFRLLVSLSLFFAAQHVSAAIYGFIDAAGVAHFATEPIDSRYQLFLRGNLPGTLDAPSTEQAGPAKPELLRYLAKHPNLKKYEPLLKAAGKKFAVDLSLLKAVMAAESAFNPEAVSPKGAIGLMQIMPDTAARYGVQGDEKQSIEQKLADPATNIRLGARHLQTLSHLFANQHDLILAAYNAGEGAVRQYKNQIPPYPETRNYVLLVSQFEQLYRDSVAPARVALPNGFKLLAGSGVRDRRIVITLQGRRTPPETAAPAPAVALSGQVPAVRTVTDGLPLPTNTAPSKAEQKSAAAAAVALPVGETAGQAVVAQPLAEVSASSADGETPAASLPADAVAGEGAGREETRPQ